MIVHEYNSTLFHQDQLCESRPISNVHRDLWWGVDVFRHARIGESRSEVANIDVIRVHDEQSHNVERVSVEPLAHLEQLRLIGACVQVVTACVAAIHGFVDVVDLSLD